MDTLTLQTRARKVTTRGQSNFKMPFFDKPLFLVRGEGSRLWDADGKEYVDLGGASGAGILGNSHPAYLAAVSEQFRSLYMSVSGMSQTPKDVELAEAFARHVPCAERVRFCVTGTEAVQLAIRLARAHTGRRLVVRFEGHYHGWLDNVLGGHCAEAPESLPHPVESEHDMMATRGRDPEALRQCLLLPWNDAGALERALREHGRDVAMVLMEPIHINGGGCAPRPGYLERARELCTEHGVVLAFDEVITGFRTALGGAQSLLGVTPDLATFGKALAGGLPMAAVAGKAEILARLEEDVVGAGTFNGYPIGVAAALATIRILEENDGAIYRRIDRIQARLTSGLKEICRRRGFPALIQGARGVFWHLFTDKPALHSVRELWPLDWDLQKRFFFRLADEGVLLMFFGRWYLSAALTDEDVDRALEGSDRVIARL